MGLSCKAAPTLAVLGTVEPDATLGCLCPWGGGAGGETEVSEERRRGGSGRGSRHGPAVHGAQAALAGAGWCPTPWLGWPQAPLRSTSEGLLVGQSSQFRGV